MIDPIEMSNDDFERAYQVAKARGMAERARVFRNVLSATSGMVRGLFSAPERHMRADRAGC
ncbi:MAG: hypothetical protein OEN23_19025 [Paracoccaceae bacterium]|nr:hypothetical protein [Paracoccaceae bacterium]